MYTKLRWEVNTIMSRKEVGKVLVDLCSIDSGLTNWEMEFIDNMAERFKMGLVITEAMESKLYEILNSKG